MEALRPLITAGQIECRWGAGFVRLEVSSRRGGPLVVTDHSDGDPLALFSDTELANGRAALAGDLDAALRLSGQWEATINVDPAKELATSYPSCRLMALPDAAAVATLLTGRSWWELRALVQPGTPVTIAVHRTSALLNIMTTSMQIISLAGLTSHALIRGAVSDILPMTLPNAAPIGTPDPAVLIPVAVSGPDDDTGVVSRALHRQASACCWAQLASNVIRTTRVPGSSTSDFNAERGRSAVPDRISHRQSMMPCFDFGVHAPDTRIPSSVSDQAGY